MGFQIELPEPDTNILSVSTTFGTTLESTVDTTGIRNVDIIENIFDSNIDSAKKSLQIESDIIRTATNIIDLEVSQDVGVDIINNVDFLGTINVTRIEGLQHYLDYDYCYTLDCGGPTITGVCA